MTDPVGTLAALAHPRRLAIFRLLVREGPGGTSAGAIARQLKLAPATLSFHLKEMALADLVSARPSGRFVYYAANYDTMNRLIAYLTENCCQGQTCVTDCRPEKMPSPVPA